MKIGITCYPVAGGSGIVATELGRKLAERGHQIHFISYALPFRFDEFQQNLFFHGVETTAYPLFKHPPYTLALATRMAEVCCQYKLELLHVHYAVPHATCAFLAKQLVTCRTPKIITTLHGTDITLVGSDPSYYDITRFSINASDGITAVSKYLADETVREFKTEKEIRVVHNFFDDNRFNPGNHSACKRNSFVTENEFLISHVSNLRPVKRALDVIDTFDRIQRKLPSKLMIIGDGPDAILVRRQVNKRKLTDKVIFLGNQSRIEAVLPLSDLFLLPSEEESFGLAALEALASGVPVIGTKGTGLTEVIDDNVNGYLCEVGDTSTMAQKGIELLSDAKKLDQFKVEAARLAHDRFNSNKIISEYEAFYREVLNA